MLYGCASTNDWDIVRVGSGVERTVRQDGNAFFAGARSMTGLDAKSRNPISGELAKSTADEESVELAFR